MSRFAAICISIWALGVTGCVEDGVQWSEQERENARYIERSLDAAARAAELANRLPPQPRPAQAEPVVEELETALAHATAVTDTVLQKAHPRLWGKFRGEYQPALARLIRYYRGGAPQEGRQAARQIREFSQWYNSHQHEFRW